MCGKIQDVRENRGLGEGGMSSRLPHCVSPLIGFASSPCGLVR